MKKHYFCKRVVHLWAKIFNVFEFFFMKEARFFFKIDISGQFDELYPTI